MIRRTVALLLVIFCIAALTSCGSDEKAAPKGGGSSVPSYAAGDDEHGAKQFATYWVDTLNKATVTGETKQLKSISLDSCTTCTDFAKQLDTIYAHGGHVETEGWQVQSVLPESGLPQGETGVSVKVKVAPQTVVKDKGGEAEQHEGGDLRIRLILARAADAWAVKALDIG